MAIREELYDDTGAQMELAGLVSEPTDTDPVSGNEIPVGATAEGVRDDQTASISPGEFVIPDYAVRYHGLDFYVESMQKAKQGLDQMQDMGLVGNPDEQTMPEETPLPSMEEEGMPPQEAGAEQVMSDTGEPMPTAEFQTGGVMMSDTGEPVDQQRTRSVQPARPVRPIQETEGMENLSVSEKEAFQLLMQQQQQQPEQRQEFQTGGLATVPIYSPTQQATTAPPLAPPPVQPIRPISTQPVPITGPAIQQPAAPLLTQYQQGYYVETGGGYYRYQGPPGTMTTQQVFTRDQLPSGAVIAPAGTKYSDVWGTTPGQGFSKQSQYLALQGSAAGQPGGYKVEAYKDAQGNIVYLTTVGGKVQGGIPPGYTKASQADLGFGAPRQEPKQAATITQQREPRPTGPDGFDPSGIGEFGQVGPDTGMMGTAASSISDISYSDYDSAAEAGMNAALAAHGIEQESGLATIGKGLLTSSIPVLGPAVGALMGMAKNKAQPTMAYAQNFAFANNDITNTHGVGNYAKGAVYSLATPLGLKITVTNSNLGVDGVQADQAISLGIDPNLEDFDPANFYSDHDKSSPTYGKVIGYNLGFDAELGFAPTSTLFSPFAGFGTGAGTAGEGGSYNSSGGFTTDSNISTATGTVNSFNNATPNIQATISAIRGENNINSIDKSAVNVKFSNEQDLAAKNAVKVLGNLRAMQLAEDKDKKSRQTKTIAPVKKAIPVTRASFRSDEFSIPPAAQPTARGLAMGARGVSGTASATGPTGYGPPGGYGGGDPGDPGGPGGTHICTATHSLGLITTPHFKSLRKYGIDLRRNDPYLMKAYDMFGPILARYVNKNKGTKYIAKFLTEYYRDIVNNKPLNTKQKIFKIISNYILRPTYRTVGWISVKL